MSAFKYPTNKPAPNSPAGKAARILQSGSVALAQLAQTRIQNYNAFWSDPVNVAAALGTSAVGVFQADAALVAFLGPQLAAANAPADVISKATAGILAGYTVTPNADGSIVVTVPTPTPAPTPTPTATK